MGHALKRRWPEAMGAPPAQFYPQVESYSNIDNLHANISEYVSVHPTRSIVIADLPAGCTDADVRNFIGKYGQISIIKMVCNGKAALVQCVDPSLAAYMVQLAKGPNFLFGSNRVRIEWATESTTPPDSQHGTDNSTTAPTPTNILHIDVAAADYPITVEVIRAICQPHGNLVRIFIGKRNVDRSLEVLVEFETAEHAQRAKDQLDGADIYSGCCSLTVTFSRLPKVHVTINGPESWDFTGPRGNLPGPLTPASSQRTLLDIRAPPIQGPPPFQFHSAYPPPVVPRGVSNHPTGTYYPFTPYGSTPTNFPPGYYPPQYPATGTFRPPNSATVPAVRSTTQNIPNQHKPVKILPTPAPVHHVTPTGIGIGHATSNLNSPSLQFRQADLSVFEKVEGVVLMISNLPPTMNCDHLFNLLCVYGNIARIKFLKSRSGCAMVQVGNAEAADFIFRYYNGVSIFGHTIQVHHSKQPELVEHENLGTLEDGSPVMKNYMTDPNNRFRNSVVAAKSRILDPSRTLHFFNTPLDFSPEDICRVLTETGATCPPRVFLFTTKVGQKTSLGLVEWDTLTEALEALVVANQRPIYVADIIHPFHLKLAFSPKPISPDRVGQALIRYPAPPFSATRPGETVEQANGDSPKEDEKDSEDNTCAAPDKSLTNGELQDSVGNNEAEQGVKVENTSNETC